MQIAFFLQFSLREDVLYVATYDRHIALEQLAKLRLRQPHGLVFKSYVQPNGLIRLVDDDLVFTRCHLNVLFSFHSIVCSLP